MTGAAVQLQVPGQHAQGLAAEIPEENEECDPSGNSVIIQIAMISRLS
jgi:hypothetical protein